MSYMPETGGNTLAGEGGVECYLRLGFRVPGRVVREQFRARRCDSEAGEFFKLLIYKCFKEVGTRYALYMAQQQ